MKKHFLVIGLLAATAVPASAKGLYFFADAGKSEFSAEVKDSDTSFDAGLGYTLNKNFSFELGYYDLGGVSYSESEVFPGFGTVNVKAAADASAIQASLIGKLPLSDSFDLYGRLGYARIEIEATATASFMGESESATESNSENKAVFGAGASYKLNEKFAIRAEYSEYNDTDISTITAGVTYAF